MCAYLELYIFLYYQISTKIQKYEDYSSAAYIKLCARVQMNVYVERKYYLRFQSNQKAIHFRIGCVFVRIF